MTSIRRFEVVTQQMSENKNVISNRIQLLMTNIYKAWEKGQKKQHKSAQNVQIYLLLKLQDVLILRGY